MNHMMNNLIKKMDENAAAINKQVESQGADLATLKDQIKDNS